MGNRERGEEFEARVAKLLNMRQTANSGAMHDDADLRPRNGKAVIAECKVKGGQNYSAIGSFRKDLHKLQEQAHRLGKDWFYVLTDKQGREIVICELDFFAEATEEFFRE